MKTSLLLLTLTLLAAVTFATPTRGDDESTKENNSAKEDVGPSKDGNDYGYGRQGYNAYGYGDPQTRLYNAKRQLYVNEVARKVGAGVGTAYMDGVPGSYFSRDQGYDDGYQGFGGYGYGGYNNFGGYNFGRSDYY